MNKSLSRKLVDKPYIVWSVLFIIAPLVMVLYYAFTDTSGAFSLSSINVIPAYTSTIFLSVIYDDDFGRQRYYKHCFRRSRLGKR